MLSRLNSILEPYIEEYEIKLNEDEKVILHFMYNSGEKVTTKKQQSLLKKVLHFVESYLKILLFLICLNVLYW